MKRGFTLIEIILSITLIVIIGAGSIVGFSIYKKYDKEKQLNNMDSEILTALRMYIETSDEIKNKVYNEKEGLAVSLQTLQNEGLIDFGDLNITDQDDYVVAFLTNESDCSDISTLKGWDFQDGKPLYICTDSNGGQNLFSVGMSAENYSQGTRETYYFKGNNPQNYIQLNGAGTKYRIISVEKDDSLILYSTASFGTTFSGKAMDVSYNSNNNMTLTDVSCENSNLESSAISLSVGSGEQIIGSIDVKNSSKCQNANSYNKTEVYSYDYVLIYSWLGSIGAQRNLMYNEHDFSIASGGDINYYFFRYTATANTGYKIHLDPCMKIVGGSGDIATPYVLREKNCS